MTDVTATLIKMEGVKKVFYTDEVETHALSEIHLEIKKGQYISIAGPSGCGKSTLLSILGLLDSPTAANTRSTASRSRIFRSANARGFGTVRLDLFSRRSI